jgi:hypothetical protein
MSGAHRNSTPDSNVPLRIKMAVDVHALVMCKRHSLPVPAKFYEASQKECECGERHRLCV